MDCIMKMLRNFKCINGHVTEKLIENSVRELDCSECGKVATRMISAPRCFGNTTGGSPSLNYTKPS